VIDRSQPPPRGHGQTFRVSPTQPRILAGKRADTIRGSNVFSLRHRPELPKQKQVRHAIALGERRRNPVRGRALPAFFQDANYHDQIVKEQNKPTAMKPPPPRMEATPLRSAHDLLPAVTAMDRGSIRQGTQNQRAKPKRASTHDQRSEPVHDRVGIGLIQQCHALRSILPDSDWDPEITSHSAGTDPKPRPSPLEASSKTGHVRSAARLTEN